MAVFAIRNIGEVYPLCTGFVCFEEELVDIHLGKDFEEGEFVGSFSTDEVDGLSKGVLGIGNAFNGFVKFVGAVAGGNNDGDSYLVSSGFEDVVH